MEPKETKSFHQSQPPNLNETSDKTPKTVAIPGMSPLPQQPSSGQNPPKIGFWEGLRWPLQRTAIVCGSLFIVLLVLSGLFNFAKGVIDGFTKPKPIATTQPQVQPIIQPTPSASPTTASSPENKCLNTPQQMAQAKITTPQVDKIFYQKHPDRVNNPISSSAADRPLRQEWCAIANELVEQKQPK